MLDDSVEQRSEVGVVAGDTDPGHGSSVTGDGRHDGEVDVVVGGVEVEEQLVHLVDDLVRAGIGPVDLVEDDNRREVTFEGLREDVAGLRLGAFGGVHEQEDAVDECQGPFDLAAEVGVAGSVDEVDAGPAPLDRRGLGEDGDPAFALLVVGVEDALDTPSRGRRTRPVAASMASTSVVLPWSTCAISAMVRKEEPDMATGWYPTPGRRPSPVEIVGAAGAEDELADLRRGDTVRWGSVDAGG